MLKQASVSDLITDRVSRDRGYVVITMRRYPRFVSRELRDEYVSRMSPSPELHESWLSAKRRYRDHDGAFARSGFERRFRFGEEGLRDLERLSELSKRRDVYFVCQCGDGRKCHRELVLLLAKKLFGAEIDKLAHRYPEFEKRIPEFRHALRELRRADAARAPSEPSAIKPDARDRRRMPAKAAKPPLRASPPRPRSRARSPQARS